MLIQLRRSNGELSNQPVTVFVDHRGPLHVGWIAGSQVHRPIAAAGAARSLEDHGVDVFLEARQSSAPFHRLDDLRSLVDLQAPVGFGGLSERLVLWGEGHADPFPLRTRGRRMATEGRCGSRRTRRRSPRTRTRLNVSSPVVR